MLSSADKEEPNNGALRIVSDFSDVKAQRELNFRGDDDSAPKTASSAHDHNAKADSQSLPTRIQSTHSSCGDGSLLELTRPTFVPNNTPVQSPLGSPQLEHSIKETAQATDTNAKSLATEDTTIHGSQISTSSLPTLPPPSALFHSNSLRDVLRNDDNGGCLPPKPENVTARVGENDHVVIQRQPTSGVTRNKDSIMSSNSSQLDNENSPIAIINRRNFFNTSDSRSSVAFQPLGAISPSLRASSKGSEEGNDRSEKGSQVQDNRGDASVMNSEQRGKIYADRRSSSSQEHGIAPTIFYFDKDRSITDPYVKHDQSNEKIKISSWLNSTQNAEIYSLIDHGSNESHDNASKSSNTKNNDTSTRIERNRSICGDIIISGVNEESRNNSSSGSNHRRPYSSDGYISPQPPRSALSMSSSFGGSGDLDLTDAADAADDTGRYADIDTDADEGKFVPPPPPRFINSKLDGLRTRLLVNPRKSNKYEEDIGTATAAAVLSNMRSTPFRFSERPQQLSNNNNVGIKPSYNSGNSNSNSASRPGSSSFSSLKTYPRPIIRVHQRESPLEDTDESAILDDDDDDDDDDDEYNNANGMEFDADDEKNGTRNRKINYKRDDCCSDDMISPTKVKKPKTDKNTKDEDITKEVTWNKNGKRVTTGKLLSGSNRRRRPRNKTTKPKVIKDEAFHATTGREDEDNEDFKEDEDDEEYSAKAESSGNKKNSMGSRSRTGCWICRLRKKKCTEERPHCFNCVRLNLQCNYGNDKPDFVLDPIKKQLKLDEIKKKTKEAKRNAMRKKPFR